MQILSLKIRNEIQDRDYLESKIETGAALAVRSGTYLLEVALYAGAGLGAFLRDATRIVQVNRRLARPGSYNTLRRKSSPVEPCNLKELPKLPSHKNGPSQRARLHHIYILLRNR